MNTIDKAVFSSPPSIVATSTKEGKSVLG